MQATDGNFYGTTLKGGRCSSGCGTVFKITSSGTLTTLYSFCSQPNCTDGSEPQAGLLQATDGNFYGITVGGEIETTYYYGTVPKITPAGVLTTVYVFCSQLNCTDGNFPFAGLVQATDGKFYGTTTEGSNPVCDGGNGCRTVYEISGTLTTLHTFEGFEGTNPYGLGVAYTCATCRR